MRLNGGELSGLRGGLKYILSSPRKRGPIFQRRWLWVPAFAGTTASDAGGSIKTTPARRAAARLRSAPSRPRDDRGPCARDSRAARPTARMRKILAPRDRRAAAAKRRA